MNHGMPVTYASLEGWGCPRLGTIDINHPVMVEYIKASEKYDQVIEDISGSETKLRAVLSSVSSLQKLEREWPELAPFLTDIQLPTKNLPAINRQTMNEAFNLPVENEPGA